MNDDFASKTNRNRREYRRGSLDESSIAADPFDQFEAWFAEAMQMEEGEVNAMALATTNEDRKPSLRMVLLKDLSREGFVFFTNYESRKGIEIGSESSVALLFYWPRLERQVRVEGICSKTSSERSNEYFKSRPRNAQIAATASTQSEAIASRAALENKCSEIEKAYDGKDIPRPENWGGYSVRPETFEFWQGRENRLHDRIKYSIDNDGVWRLSRLSP